MRAQWAASTRFPAQNWDWLAGGRGGTGETQPKFEARSWPVTCCCSRLPVDRCVGMVRGEVYSNPLIYALLPFGFGYWLFGHSRPLFWTQNGPKGFGDVQGIQKARSSSKVKAPSFASVGLASRFCYCHPLPPDQEHATLTTTNTSHRLLIWRPFGP